MRFDTSVVINRDNLVSNFDLTGESPHKMLYNVNSI